MARIIWKENKIISIKLRKDLYVLAQMQTEPYILFFNLFNTNNAWNENVILDNNHALFCTAVTRQFLNNSEILHIKKIKPLLTYIPALYWIKKNVTGHREITFWKETENETTISTLGEGGGELIEKNILKRSEQEVNTIMEEIPFSDNETINSFELTNVRMFPELNERLYLCYKFNRNLDPLKDITFNREIPFDYKIYLKIINGDMA